jgi:hypothetical protein
MTTHAQASTRICHFICFLAIACLLWAHSASAQTIERCIEQKRERTAAVNARDWPNLDRLSKRYVQSCRGVTGAQDISNAYEDIARANRRRHRAQDALEAANMCVTTYYANPGCHLEKAQAMLALNRLIEARDILDVTERLLKSALTENDLAFRSAYHSLERELHLTIKKNYEAQLGLVEDLRVQYFGY